MKRINSSLISIFIIIFSLNNRNTSAEELSSFNRVCYGNSTIDNSSTYNNFKNNVYSLISTLASKSSSSSSLFYNTSTIGEVNPRAYGSYFCRGDLKARVCQKCVSDVTGFLSRADITNSDCYGAGVYYKDPQCIVHYANSSTIDVYEKGRALDSDSIGEKVTDYHNYNETLSNTMQGLIREAALGNWTEPDFETRVVDVIGSTDEKIYVLVQCTPDISAMNCSQCLGELFSSLPHCCNGTQGGYVAYGNCLIKYNNLSFFGSAYHSFLPNLWHVTLVLIVTMYIVFMEC